jgi:hypothetical protein
MEGCYNIDAKGRLNLFYFLGYLGELTLVIPWQQLKQKPVRILINDVFLLASPSFSDTVDEPVHSNLCFSCWIPKRFDITHLISIFHIKFIFVVRCKER